MKHKAHHKIHLKHMLLVHYLDTQDVHKELAMSKALNKLSYKELKVMWDILADNFISERDKKRPDSLHFKFPKTKAVDL